MGGARIPEMKVVSVIAYRRPQYLKQVLESLARCDGIQDWAVMFNLEPGSDEVSALAMNFLRCRAGARFLNKERLGHTMNFYLTFKRPFDMGADYVALVEEDALVAKDFLRWHDFAREHFRNDPTVFTVAGGHYTTKGKINEAELPLFAFNHMFHNKGWATWKDRWFEPGGMNEVWENPDEVTSEGLRTNYKYFGYEGCIERVHIKGRRQAFPVVTRVRDIGEDGGTHCTPGVFKDIVEIQDWADNYDTTGIQFKERK